MRRNLGPLLREAATLGMLSHRHIVRYYSTWVEGGNEDMMDGEVESESDSEGADDSLMWSSQFTSTAGFGNGGALEGTLLYIQQEYCAGGSLEDALERGTVQADEDVAWRVLTETLEALAYVHDQGMVHRDIKPGNVMLDEAGSVKLGDFGLATPQGDAGDHTDAVGTPVYIAPEGGGSPAADMYALVRYLPYPVSRICCF